MNKELTSRERVRLVLNGKIPDRVPFNFWMDRDAMEEYDKRWGRDFRLTHYGVDVIEAFACLPFWSNVEMKSIYDGKTIWQTEPLVKNLAEVFDLPLPDPSDPALYADVAAKREKYPDKAIFAMMIAPLDILQPLRLAENLYMELYDSACEIHQILGRIKPLMIETARRVCKMDIDVLYIAGDICGRDGALVSPRHLREFLFEYLKEVIEIAHSAGKKVFYHTDGYVLDILDLFIEYGFDGINPVEPRYNDPAEFIKRTNGKLVLYGGLDNCNIIPNGNVQDVSEHVMSQFSALGRSGRLIFSSHDIPSHCPLHNLDCMVDTIKNCCYEPQLV
ncbi:MAG: uroporphyrinogen decarboxylase family protein [Armatimonadota bacterium]